MSLYYQQLGAVYNIAACGCLLLLAPMTSSCQTQKVILMRNKSWRAHDHHRGGKQNARYHHCCCLLLISGAALCVLKLNTFFDLMPEKPLHNTHTVAACNLH